MTTDDAREVVRAAVRKVQPLHHVFPSTYGDCGGDGTKPEVPVALSVADVAAGFHYVPIHHRGVPTRMPNGFRKLLAMLLTTVMLCNLIGITFTSGPHLHWEWRKPSGNWWEDVDPMGLLPKWSKEITPLWE